MTIRDTNLKGCFIVEPKVFNDERGSFYEIFKEKIWHKETGIAQKFVQDNVSHSSYGVLRGLHFQTGDFAQAKLVSVLQGRMLDVAVDLRPHSPTCLQHFTIELSAENHLQLYVPRGFAHGFVVLSEQCTTLYKCDAPYSPQHESGILFNDEDLGIDWKIPAEDFILNQKDRELQSLQHFITHNPAA